MNDWQLIEEFQKRWKLVMFVVVLIGGASIAITNTRGRIYANEKASAANKKANTEQDAKLDRLTELTLQLAESVKGLDDKMAMILQLYGIDTFKINRWKELPASPKVDSTGRIIPGAQWLDIVAGGREGNLVRAYIDSTGRHRVETRTLWNLSKSESK